MNQKTSLAQFKKNKPKPFYRQYFLFNLGSWFLAISSQFFVILGLCLVIFSSDKQYVIVGTVAIIVGLVIPILLACHLRNKEL